MIRWYGQLFSVGMTGRVRVDERAVDGAVCDQPAREAVEKHLIRLRTERQMLRRRHRRLGHPWIDDDDLRVVRIAQHPLPQDRMRNAEVCADQNDDVRFLEVAVGVGRRVEAECLLVGDHRCRHALTRVAVPMAHAHAELGKRPEQRHLLGRHLAGAEKRDRLRTVRRLDGAEPIDHRVERRVPGYGAGRTGGVTNERHGRTVGGIEDGECLPTLGAGDAAVDGVGGGRRDVDSTITAEMDGEAAAGGAVAADQVRRGGRLGLGGHLAETETGGFASEVGGQGTGASDQHGRLQGSRHSGGGHGGKEEVALQ